MTRRVIAATIFVALLLLCHLARQASADTDSTSSHLANFTALFHSWAPSVNKKVSFRRGPYGSGVFVEAKSGVTPREPVMAVPMQLVLCADSIGRRPYASGVELSRIGDEADVIALAVIVEKLLGRATIGASPLWPWVASLPAMGPDMAPLFSWTPAQLAAVEPRSLRNDAQRTRDEIDGAYRRLRSQSNVLGALEAYVARQQQLHRTSSAAEDGAKGGESAVPRITQADYTWARSLIDTRAWNINGRKYFVPGADMFNHAPDAEDLAFDPARRPLHASRSQKFLAHHKVDHVDRSVSHQPVALVLSDRAAGWNQEFHESYGDNSDFIYFNYHGFVPSAPEKFVPRRLSNSTAAERKEFADKWKRERRLRNVYDTQPMPLDCSGWEYPTNDRDALLKLANGTAKPKMRGTTDASAVSSRFGKAAEKRMGAVADRRCRALRTWLQARLPNPGRGGQPTVQLYFGEVDPVLRFIQTVSLFPPAVTQAACFTELSAAKTIRPSEPGSFHRTYADLLAKVLNCADGVVMTLRRGAAGNRNDGNDDHDASGVRISAEAWNLAGLRSTKLALLRFAESEFPLRGLDTDQDVADIERALGVLDAPSVGQQGDARHDAAITLTRARMALQRRMIVREMLRRTEKLIKRSLAKLQESAQRHVSTTNDEL